MTLADITANPTNWVALAFVGFVVLFIRYALKPITKGLDDRSERIQLELDEAVRLREEAQAVLAQYQKKQKEVIKEAETILETAKAEAEAMKEDAEIKLKETLERRMAMANEKIARAEQDAIRDVQTNMVDIAIHAAREIIVDQIDDATDEELIRLAVDDVKRIVH